VTRPSTGSRTTIGARFYRLTAAGRRQLEAETRNWKETMALIRCFFDVKAEDLS